ncbi:hypothetical protein EMIT0158MI4_70188 [Burkholderia ambifaria]
MGSRHVRGTRAFRQRGGVPVAATRVASRRDERYVTSRRALRRLTGTSQRAHRRTWHAHLAKPLFLRLNRGDIPDFRNKAPVRRAKDVMARNLQ